MAKKKKDSIPKKGKANPIDVHYIKTGNYRTYHVDGIYGGLTNDGVHIQPFVQRFPTPQCIQQEITPEGLLGKEVPNGREGKKGIVREIDSGFVMNIEVATVLRDWLSNKIKLYNKLKLTSTKKKGV